MTEAIVPGYICTVCDTYFNQDDVRKPWEEHKTLPITGLNFRVGDVLGYGAAPSHEIMPPSVVVVAIKNTPDVQHQRRYHFLQYSFRSFGDMLIIDAKNLPGFLLVNKELYELSKEQFEEFKKQREKSEKCTNLERILQLRNFSRGVLNK